MLFVTLTGQDVQMIWSITGFAVFLGDCLIAWSAKKQVVVSRSSTEAKYRSLSITTAELFWIRMLLKEIQVYLADYHFVREKVLNRDILLKFTTAELFWIRMLLKEIQVYLADYHFVREKVLNRDILLKFISTQDQVADLFTKGLSSAQFLLLKSKLLVVPTPINFPGGGGGCSSVSSKQEIKCRPIP
jgi:uncharacterized protein related to proFAR isomerase